MALDNNRKVNKKVTRKPQENHTTVTQGQDKL
jgi:hypothetical protein